ncbi:MAG: tRNA (adenosine(37)-N6)-threonylcarbamoyltransferase complex dimerization subunit type 1 TsaB [Thermoleophilaceae bacterium]
MNVLGFDTSTALASASVLRSDGEAFESGADPARLLEPPAHARELMPAIATVLERSGLRWPELDAIAVGVGPGSFTGLRIGVSTARALARASGLELRPVSSLRTLAAGIDAPVRLPLIDAKRGELFAASYEGENERWAPFTASPEQLLERLEDERTTVLAAGDGSIRSRSVLEAAGIRVEPDGSPAHLVRALNLCRLAGSARPVPPDAVLPEYLRLPDATPSP